MKALAAVLFALTLSASPDKNPKKTTPSSPKTNQETMTGCLDQRGERYVLTSETDMTAVTQLKGKGFSDDNFARYIGQKVTIQGKANGSIFEVVKVTKVADTCSK
jgi:hypothetical protein